MAALVTHPADQYWPKGEAYQTPRPEGEEHPLCRCGAKHLLPIPSCRRDNTLKDLDNG